MADTIQAGIRLKRLVRRLAMPLMAAAFVACVVIIALQIADDFNGYITALVSCVLALASLRPIFENICWALRVIFGLPIKAAAKADEWLSSYVSAEESHMNRQHFADSDDEQWGENTTTESDKPAAITKRNSWVSKATPAIIELMHDLAETLSEETDSAISLEHGRLSTRLIAGTSVVQYVWFEPQRGNLIVHIMLPFEEPYTSLVQGVGLQCFARQLGNQHRKKFYVKLVPEISSTTRLVLATLFREAHKRYTADRREPLPV